MVQRLRDPPYSVCGCSNTSTVCRKSFSSLCEYGSHNGSRTVYVAPLLQDLPSGQSEFCKVLRSSSDRSSGNKDDNNGTGNSTNSASGESVSSDSVTTGGCDSVRFKPGYVVDGLSADLLSAGVCDCGEGVTSRGCECGEGEGEGMVSAHYYQESEETLSVTVWYNNRVSQSHITNIDTLHIELYVCTGITYMYLLYVCMYVLANHAYP